jgi:hypothetical protein
MKVLWRSVLVGLVAAAIVAVLGTFTLHPMVAGFLGGYKASIETGQTDLPVVAQFRDVYPNAQHFISYYTGSRGPPTWRSEVYLHGRYELTLQMKIGFNLFRRRVHKIGEPQFQLLEIESVTQETGRGVEIRYGDTHVEFGQSEWDSLLRANGDLRVLGIEPRLNDPVPGFERAFAAQ